MNTFSINISGRLVDFARPIVMAILNVTPDSFVEFTRLQSEIEILHAAEDALANGAAILDVGGYSTRPGASVVSMEEEWLRIKTAVGVIRHTFPSALVSVDTFRAEVARRAVLECGADIVNDVSGGQLDGNMFATIANLQVPYILMHMRGTPETMQTQINYNCLMADIMDYFCERLEMLSQLGVKDVLIDPGFGFAKTAVQNYQLLSHLSELTVFRRPLLAGLSRKSMLYKILDITPEDSLNATTAVNMVALMNGANVLRVHDVKAAMEAVTVYRALCGARN